MITNNQTKLLISLKQKKYRQEYGYFVVEGFKIAEELLTYPSPYKIEKLFALEEWIKPNTALIQKANVECIAINESQLERISQLQKPNKVLALCCMAKEKATPADFSSLTLALDTINDPGNLGTIIRIADWFGIDNIICSEDTVDLYNSKVIQASMGSFLRVNIYYTNLPKYLKETTLPIYGTFLNGENIYTSKLANPSIIVIGNEANGISDKVAKIIKNRITIPNFRADSSKGKAESLNAAMSTALVVNEFARNRI